jgi:hypothetical protein
LAATAADVEDWILLGLRQQCWIRVLPGQGVVILSGRDGSPTQTLLLIDRLLLAPAPMTEGTTRSANDPSGAENPEKTDAVGP